MPDFGANPTGLPSQPGIEEGENYCERRGRLHDCMTFNVPAKIYLGDFQNGRSRLEQLPQEVLLVIKSFLSFKSRCCFALASKFLGNLILDPPLADAAQLQVYNNGHKEFFVNLPPAPSSLPNLPATPTQKMTHVCGEYKDLLRTLSKDWNSTMIRLCQSCSAWRPLSEQYWKDKARKKLLDSRRTAAWTKGGECRCPECGVDCRLLFSDIDGVSGMVSGVITG